MNIPLFTTFCLFFTTSQGGFLLDFPPGCFGGCFTLARRPKGQGYGRQRASCVRDDFDSYEFCSGLAAMLPQKNTSYLEKPHGILTFFIIVFFVERKKHTLLFWSFFIIRNDTSENSFLYQMDWFRSLLQGLLCLWCTTSS